MTLIKKTCVLTKSGTKGARGYITVIRVGDSVGAKVSFDGFYDGLYAAIKLGNGDTVVKRLSQAKSEIDLGSIDFSSTDEICAVITDGHAEIASGGKRSLIDTHSMYKKIAATEGKQSDAFDSYDEMDTKAASLVEDPKMANSAYENINNTDERSKEHPDEKSSKDGSFISSDLLKGLTEKDFYLSVKDKLDELFVIYPSEPLLEKIVPSSKWVKINYDGEDYYVTGVLREKGRVSHIVYGVPAIKEVPPPKGTENICDFLPVPGMEKYSGYYLIFQDVETGEIIPNG